MVAARCGRGCKTTASHLRGAQPRVGASVLPDVALFNACFICIICTYPFRAGRRAEPHKRGATFNMRAAGLLLGVAAVLIAPVLFAPALCTARLAPNASDLKDFDSTRGFPGKSHDASNPRHEPRDLRSAATGSTGPLSTAGVLGYTREERVPGPAKGSTGRGHGGGQRRMFTPELGDRMIFAPGPHPSPAPAHLCLAGHIRH